MITVNGNKVEWIKGMTVSDALHKAALPFPHLVVSVNGQIVANDRFEDFEIGDQAEVRAMLIAHGG